MKDYEKLKQAIQQANPEIMELKFGCEVLILDDPMISGRIVTPLDHSHKTYLLDLGDGTHEAKKEDFIEIYGRPIRCDDVVQVQGIDKHYLIDNWKPGFLEDQSEDLINTLYEQARIK